MSMMRGIRVVEVATWTYVPVAGAILAEWGADVIKFEHPETGDPQRGLAAMGLIPSGPGGVEFMMELANRGKRCVGVDVQSDEGRALLLKAATTADVFLTNLRPQARRKLRIDVSDVRAVNPDIIYVRGSGQGQRGPDAERGGMDGTTFWARGGGADVASNHDSDSYPVGLPGLAFGDLIGGMTIAGGISAALFHRQRTGEPVIVDSSLLAAGMWATGASILMAGLFGFSHLPPRDRKQVPNPLVNTYKTSDNRFINLVMLQSDRYWADLVTACGRSDLADDPRFIDASARAGNNEECVTVLDDIFAGRTFADWKQLLAKVNGIWAPVQTPAELLGDPQAIANGYIRDVESASGTVFQMVSSPVQFDEEAPSLIRAPKHGEHTEEVLQELGLQVDEILDLKIRGAVL